MPTPSDGQLTYGIKVAHAMDPNDSLQKLYQDLKEGEDWDIDFPRFEACANQLMAKGRWNPEEGEEYWHMSDDDEAYDGIDDEDDDEEFEDSSDHDQPKEFDFPLGNGLNGKLSVLPDVENENVESINLYITSGTGEERVGGIAVQFILGGICADFQEEMDAIDNDCATLASTIFDGSGGMLSKWIEGPHKGNGVWAQRQGGDNFMVMEKVMVNLPFRGKGQGRVMVDTLLDLARARGAKYVYTLPMQLNDAEDSSHRIAEADAARRSEVLAENKRKAVSFWRAMGFRRVGETSWFCYALDPAHPSHQLAAVNDFDPVGQESTPAVPEDVEMN